MPGPNPATQTAAAQQGNQLQAEQYLAAQRKAAQDAWMSFLGAGSPAAHWPGIAPPNYAGMPSQIGGGVLSPSGSLKDQYVGYQPSPASGPGHGPTPGPEPKKARA